MEAAMAGYIVAGARGSRIGAGAAVERGEGKVADFLSNR
jgi:hypothetical protein